MTKGAAPSLVLASGSPRRTALLTRWGLEHTVDPARVPETLLPGETPEVHVERLAREKARAVAARHPGALVLAGDTEVVDGGRVLGKPRDEAHARSMLRKLSGRGHRVVTGLALAGPGPDELRSRWDTAEVTFRDLSDADVEAYVATGEPMDKAGAYGIQGLGGALVTRVEGDYYTVVGLPVSGLVALLEEAGWRYAFGKLVRR
jgi:septum formation protein